MNSSCSRRLFPDISLSFRRTSEGLTPTLPGILNCSELFPPFAFGLGCGWFGCGLMRPTLKVLATTAQVIGYMMEILYRVSFLAHQKTKKQTNINLNLGLSTIDLHPNSDLDIHLSFQRHVLLAILFVWLCKPYSCTARPYILCTFVQFIRGIIWQNEWRFSQVNKRSCPSPGYTPLILRGLILHQNYFLSVLRPTSTSLACRAFSGYGSWELARWPTAFTACSRYSL